MNPSKGGLARWHACYALAERRLPDEVWRLELARTLREAAGVAFAAVHTCPSGRPWQLTHAIWPHAFDPLMVGVRERFLPRIEAIGEGASFALPRFGRVYAPIEVTRSPQLADEIRAYLGDGGIAGYVVTFLGDVDGHNDGVVILGDGDRSDRVLERAGAGLLGLAELAARAGATRSLEARSRVELVRELTDRQREIAELLAEGLSNVNVAARLGIAEATVAVHARAIYRRLGVHTRVELANRLRDGGAR